MKIKLYNFLFFLILSVLGYSQPAPTWFYPDKIKIITEQLKTDSLNYKLIWKRLEMAVALKDSIATSV